MDKLSLPDSKKYILKSKSSYLCSLSNIFSNEKNTLIFTLISMYIFLHKDLFRSVELCLNYFKTFRPALLILSFFIFFTASFSFHFKSLKSILAIGIKLFLIGSVLSCLRYDFLLILFKSFDGSIYQITSKPLWFWQIDILQIVSVIYIFVGLFHYFFKSYMWTIVLAWICFYIDPLFLIPVLGMILAQLSIYFRIDVLFKPLEAISFKIKILGIYSLYWVIILWVGFVFS